MSSTETYTLIGHYRWSLLLDLDGPSKKTIKESHYSRVSTKQFIQKLQKEVSSHSVSVSAEVERKVVAWSAKVSASYKHDYQYHNEAINQLSHDTETTKSMEVITEIDIPADQHRKVYYLVYSFPGVEMPLNVFSEYPKDVDVEIEVTVKVQKDTMRAGECLEMGQSLSSIDGQYHLLVQANGNLVLYAGPSSTEPPPPWPWATVWSSGTQDKGNPPYRLLLQGDGNLVLYSAGNTPQWRSDTQGKPAVKLVMQNDRNLVLYNGAGKSQWSTETCYVYQGPINI